MARKATGAVVEHVGRDGRTYRALRFTAYGKRRYVTLGPVDLDTAERKLRITLDQVQEGTWRPPAAVEPPVEPEPMPTFDEFAAQWWVLNRDRWSARTVEDYTWRLKRRGGLLDCFGSVPLDRITVDTVERYIAEKLAEQDRLSGRSINMTLTLLATILESALERDLIHRNPAKGRQRRAPERTPERTYVDGADAISALLAAAQQLDESARVRGRDEHVHRRAIVVLLVFAGLRIGELCGLRWRHVDLAAGWLRVEQSKTDAGVRRIKVRGVVRDALVDIKPRDADPDAYVFATRTGGQMNPSNIRNRILTRAVELANEQLRTSNAPPLPHLTPHGCRRTFASVLYALGESPAVVMAEMGHTSPALALRVYAQAMRRSDDENRRLSALVDGCELAVSGSRGEVLPCRRSSMRPRDH